MARKVEVSLTTPQELALMDRYSRKCTPESLIQRAIKEVVALQNPPQEKVAPLNAVWSEPPPVIKDLLATFELGTKLYDKEGREVSALILSEDVDNIKNGLWLVAQFDQNDAEWFPITAEDLSIVPPAQTSLLDQSVNETPVAGL